MVASPLWGSLWQVHVPAIKKTDVKQEEKHGLLHPKGPACTQSPQQARAGLHTMSPSTRA